LPITIEDRPSGYDSIGRQATDGSRGRRIVNVVPTPTLLATAIVPWCWAMRVTVTVSSSSNDQDPWRREFVSEQPVLGRVVNDHARKSLRDWRQT
jgi:hypothetical protein